MRGEAQLAMGERMTRAQYRTRTGFSNRNHPSLAEWLIWRSGPEKTASAAPGSRQYPPLGPAPGTYVHE